MSTQSSYGFKENARALCFTEGTFLSPLFFKTKNEYTFLKNTNSKKYKDMHQGIF